MNLETMSKMTLTNFLKTNEGQQIIWLDYWGYHLADKQQDLTPLQSLFLMKGRMKLEEEMRKAEQQKYSSMF